MAHATLQPQVTKPRARAVQSLGLSNVVLGCAALLLVALVLPITWGHVYVADDLGQFHLPARAFYSDALAHGYSFDWWPQLFGGFYLTGEGQAGTYHPLHWALYRWLPLALAFNLEVVLSYPWMFLGTYLWLRRRLPRSDAALFGALLFTFCGFNLLHFVHVNAVAVLAQLPWLLWAIDVAVRDPRPRWRLAAIVAIPLLTASQILLAYPQYVWYSLLVQAGYAWWLLSARVTAGPRDDAAGRKWLTLIAATTAGVLLGAIQWLPTFDMLSSSARKEAGTAFAEWGSLHPWNLMQLVAPYLFVNRVVGLNTHELGLYAGCVPLVLCAWLWMRRRELVTLRPLVVGAAGVAILALWMALGQYGFIYRLQTWLPVVGKFRFPCRIIVLFQLAMAVLGAAAFALLATRQATRTPTPLARYRTLWMLVGVSVVVSAVAALAWPQYVASWPKIIAGPLLLGVATVLVWLADRNSRTALAALAVLAAADLGAYGLSYSVYGQTARLADYAAEWPAPPASTADRLLIDSTRTNANQPRAGNRCLLAGWSRIDGYAGLEPAKRLDYRQLNAQRVAGIGWIGVDSANAAATPGMQGKEKLEGRVLVAAQGAPLPPVRFVTHVRPTDDPARDIQFIDPATTALVEKNFGKRHTVEAPTGSVEITQQLPGRLVVNTNSNASRLLVTNQSWHRGWRASVDGQPANVVRVNGDFFGCLVPQGDHRVEFRFEAPGLRHGMMFGAAGLACMILSVLWLGRGRRPLEGKQEHKL